MTLLAVLLPLCAGLLLASVLVDASRPQVRPLPVARRRPRA